MGRTAKKSDLDLVFDKIDRDIAQLEALKARLLTVRAEAAASAPAAPEKKSHKRKPTTPKGDTVAAGI